jgi:hypothetical protein
MTKKTDKKFTLPLKAMPKSLNRRIKMRLFWTNIKMKSKAAFTAPTLPRLATVAALAVVISVGGNFGIEYYAYNSDAVDPNHFLYETKRELENDTIASTTSQSELVAIYFDYSDRRLAEAEGLLEDPSTAFSLFETAYAQELITVELDEDDQVAELIVESNNFQTLAIEEINDISDLNLLEELSDKAATWEEKHQTRLNRLQPKLKKRGLDDFIVKHRNASDLNWKEVRAVKKQVKEARVEGVKELRPELKGQWLEIRHPGQTESQAPRHIRNLPRAKKIHKRLHKELEGLPLEERAELREELSELSPEERLIRLENSEEPLPLSNDRNPDPNQPPLPEEDRNDLDRNRLDGDRYNPPLDQPDAPLTEEPRRDPPPDDLRSSTLHFGDRHRDRPPENPR